jgi:hypothetical protein
MSLLSALLKKLVHVTGPARAVIGTDDSRRLDHEAGLVVTITNGADEVYLQTNAMLISYRNYDRAHFSDILLSRVCGDYIRRGIGLTTGFIGSHTITVYTLYNSLQFTCRVFTLYLHSLPLFHIAGFVRLQLCNSSLKTAARPEYSLVTGTVHVTNSTLSISEDSAPTAATNSYGIPCPHQSSLTP